MTDLATICALSVKCPKCKAPPLEDCRSPKPYHTARASAGLNRARVDEHRQHERAARAQGRLRQALAAGQRPDDTDVTTALACTCTDCGLHGLLPLFAAAAEAAR